MKNKIKTYLRAGYAALYCLSHEEERITGELIKVAEEMKYSLWQWTVTAGLSNGSERIQKTEDPLAALSTFIAHDVSAKGEPKGKPIANKSIVVFKDLHLYLKQATPILIRKIKEAISIGMASNRHIIILGPTLHLPVDLEKEITVVEFSLPSRDELKVIAEETAKSAKLELNGETEAILDAGSGLTTQEFGNACAWSVADRKTIDPAVIADIKSETIKKGGILEVVKPGVSFNDIGGLHELKSWISKRKRAFTKEAVEYGLPTPKGVCMFGVQGGGKSFATKAIATELGCPLIKLDAGRLFGGLVGSSESNVRSVISQVEAFGKCVLQIDEIDKGFAGMTGGHDGDSGTTRRVIGTFLTWMSDKTSPVFIVATANDLTRLPPELLRKGRWDELFFIDLPTFDERVEIWRVQIKKHGRKPDDFSLDSLSEATHEWTGAEIEALFGEGLYHSFDKSIPPTTEILISLSTQTVPLSKTMGESITSLREWAKGRAKPASAPQENKKASTSRRLA